MAGNGIPTWGRVNLAALVAKEGLPSDYKVSVSTLCQSLHQYPAAIVQLPVGDGALLRSCLESARLYFHHRSSCPSENMIIPTSHEIGAKFLVIMQILNSGREIMILDLV